MANYGGQNYTSFSAVNLKGSAALRLSVGASGMESTVSTKSDDEGSRAWQFPAKSGTFPIMGTFAVQLPSGVAAFFSTAVTVSGIRAEDAVVVQLNSPASIGYDFDNSTAYILVSARPTNGGLTLFFNNPGNATAYIEQVCSYVAMR